MITNGKNAKTQMRFYKYKCNPKFTLTEIQLVYTATNTVIYYYKSVINFEFSKE